MPPALALFGALIFPAGDADPISVINDVVDASNMLVGQDSFLRGEEGRSAGSVGGQITVAIEEAKQELQDLRADWVSRYAARSILDQNAQVRDEIQGTMTEQAKTQAQTTANSQSNLAAQQIDGMYLKLSAFLQLEVKKLSNALGSTVARLGGATSTDIQKLSFEVNKVVGSVPSDTNRNRALTQRQSTILESEVDDWYEQLAEAATELDAFPKTIDRAVGTAVTRPQRRQVWSGGCSYGLHNPTRGKYCFDRTDFNTMQSTLYSISNNDRFSVKVDGMWHASFWQFAHAQNAWSSILMNGKVVSYYEDRRGNGDNGWSYWGGYQNDIVVPAKAGDSFQIDADRFGGSWTWHGWNSNGNHGGATFEFQATSYHEITATPAM